jgi:hypothetical protein
MGFVPSEELMLRKSHAVVTQICFVTDVGRKYKQHDPEHHKQKKAAQAAIFKANA